MDSSAVMSPDEQYMYTLTGIYDGNKYYMFFATFDFFIIERIGNIFSTSVRADKSYCLVYNDYKVYGLLHSLNGNIFFEYDPISDAMVSYHQTFTDYVKFLITPDSKYAIIPFYY